MHTLISGMVSALRVSRGEALHEKSFQRQWQEGLKRASPERTPETFGHVAGRHLDYLSKSNTKAYSFAWYQIPLLFPSMCLRGTVPGSTSCCLSHAVDCVRQLALQTTPSKKGARKV